MDKFLVKVAFHSIFLRDEFLFLFTRIDVVYHSVLKEMFHFIFNRNAYMYINVHFLYYFYFFTIFFLNRLNVISCHKTK